MAKQICLMTKSLKDRDYCVTGIELQSGTWVRLVSSKEGGAVSKELLDRNGIDILDVIEIELKDHVPYKTQVENWLIDDVKPIIKIGAKTLHEIIALRGIDRPQFIFGNSKNELSKDEIKGLNHSLEFIKVKNLTFDTCVKGDGRNHHRISFDYMSNKYSLALTDPKLRIARLDGWVMPDAVIIVSIPPIAYGENELYYKFVAKVFF